MKLRNFNGGLSSRYASNKIGDNQAVQCNNVDYTANTIAPVKNVAKESMFTETGEIFYRFKNVIHTADAVSGLQPLFFVSQRSLYKLSRNSAAGTGVLQQLIDTNWFSVGLKPEVSAINITQDDNATPANNDFLGLPIHSTEDVTTLRQATRNFTYAYKQPGDTILTSPGSIEVSGLELPDIINTPEWLANDGSVYASWLKPFQDDIAKLKYSETFKGILKDIIYNLLSKRVTDTVEIRFTLASSVKTTAYSYEDVEANPSAPPTYRNKNNSKVLKSVDYEDTYAVAYYVNDNLQSNYATTYGLATSSTDYILGEPVIETKNTYKYLITFYSTIAAVESAAHIIESEVQMYDWGSIALTFTATPKTASYYDRYKVYRIGGSATKYTEVYEGPITRDAVGTYTFNDNDLSDSAYIDGKLFDTLAKAEPPTDITHAIEIGGRVLLAAKSSLYMNELGDISSYPVLNTVEFNSDITALAESSSGVLVFLENNKTYLLMLVREGFYTKRLFSGNQGCKTPASLQYFKGHPIWVSNDGVCTTGVSGVQVISKDTQGKLSLDVVASIVYDERYYALLADDTIFVCDFRFGGITFYTLSDYANATSFLVLDDVLYIVIDKRLLVMFSVNAKQYKYITGVFDANVITKDKIPGSIRIYRNDTADLFISILDDEGKKLINNNSYIKKSRLIEVKIPATLAEVKGLQLDLRGYSEIVEINFTVEELKNDCC